MSQGKIRNLRHTLGNRQRYHDIQFQKYFSNLGIKGAEFVMLQTIPWDMVKG